MSGREEPRLTGMSPARGAFRVAGTYVVFASAWILASDLVLQSLFGIGGVPTRIAIAKGLAFVAITGAGLYLLVRRQLVTQRLLLEQRLADEQWFRALVENAYEVYSVIDAEGQPMYRSPSFYRLLGYSPADGGTIHFRELLHPDDRERIERALEELLRQPYRTTPRIPLRLRARDGQWLECEAVATNLLDHPAVRGIVVNWREWSAPERGR